MRYFVLIAVGLSLLGCAGTPVQSGDWTSSILVLGDDADLRTVSRNDRLFGAVEQGMEQPIYAAGYTVLTENELFPDRGEAAGIRRNAARTMAMLTTTDQPAARYAALCALFADARHHDTHTAPRVRLDVSLVDMASGSQIDAFQLASDSDWRLTRTCTGSCLTGALGEQAYALAGTAAGRISERVSGVRQGRGGKSANTLARNRVVTLHFVGFETDEIYALEDQLQAHRAAQDLRLTYSSWYRVTYAYQSTQSFPRLRKTLATMLETQGLGARMTVDDARIEIERTGLKTGWYPATGDVGQVR